MEDLQKQLVPLLKESGAEFAGIFGSTARGEETADSDVDVLVRFSKPTGIFELVGIQDRLSKQLKKRVDLITEGSLCKHIRDQVLGDLVVLYGKTR